MFLYSKPIELKFVAVIEESDNKKTFESQKYFDKNQ